MAALLHLDAGEGWTEHPPSTNIDEVSAILVDVYRESALDCMVAKLDQQHVKCTEISGQIKLAASFCELAHCRGVLALGLGLVPMWVDHL